MATSREITYWSPLILLALCWSMATGCGVPGSMPRGALDAAALPDATHERDAEAALDDTGPSCSATTCAGCCDAEGHCQIGVQDRACGVDGQRCDDCVATDATCVLGACQVCEPQCAGQDCGAPDGCQDVCDVGSGCVLGCWLGDTLLRHGESMQCYERATAPFPERCEDYAETRRCDDGNLTGSHPHAQCAQEKLRVLLWNILVAGWEHDGIAHWDDGRRQKVITVIRDVDPDVMLLQEVTPEMYQDLLDVFGNIYHSHYKQKTVGNLCGNVILSKLTLRNRGGFYIDDRGRNCAVATIRGIRFYSCHTPPPGNYSDAYRIAAARVIAAEVEEPLVLGGDFNTQGSLGIYDIIRDGRDACGGGVDHIFTDQSCAQTQIIMRADNDDASDHAARVIRVPS